MALSVHSSLVPTLRRRDDVLTQVDSRELLM